MKDKETEYLNNLFARSSDELDESDMDFPMMDVPARLADRLYAITESTPVNSHSNKQRTFKSWPKLTGVAASLLLAVVLMQVYQQQQTLKQLKQAQTDLSTALHYLGEANKITQAQMFSSLDTNMKKAAVAPVVEIGRDAVKQTAKSLKSATKTPNRTL